MEWWDIRVSTIVLKLSEVGGYDGVCDEEEYDDHSEVGNLEFLF